MMLKIMRKEIGSRSRLKICWTFIKLRKGKERKKQNCVVFRSAVVVAALSFESINSRNMIHLNEAKAVWFINKIVGVDYMKDEEEVSSKIMIMEAEDERANQDSWHDDLSFIFWFWGLVFYLRGRVCIGCYRWAGAHLCGWMDGFSRS